MNLANMKRSETTEQIGLINWARANEEYVPELRLLHHIPNEGIRTNGPVLKAAGMKAGVPDLSLPVPRRGFHGLYIEMKFGKGKTTKAQEEFMALLREQGLWQHRDELATSLPYGLQRRLEIARALATEPKLLLLDEPAAGMNPQETIELASFIHDIRDKYHLTILLIEHHMDLVMNISDRIYVLDFGSLIAQGLPAEIQKNQHVIDAYLGVVEDE